MRYCPLVSADPIDPQVASTWAARETGPPESRIEPESRWLRTALRWANRLPRQTRSYARAAVLHSQRSEVVRLRTVWGVFVASKSDHAFMKSVFDEPLESALLWRLITPGSTFIDCGANRGWYTIMAADRVGPEGRVLGIRARRAGTVSVAKEYRRERLLGPRNSVSLCARR